MVKVFAIKAAWFIFALLFSMSQPQVSLERWVLLALAAVSLSAFFTFAADKKPVFLLLPTIGFAGIGLYDSNFLAYLPLLVFDCSVVGVRAAPASWVAYALLLLPTLNRWGEKPLETMVLLCLSAIAVLLALYVRENQQQNQRYYAVIDQQRRANYSLNAKNKEILDRRDLELNLSTLNERNRIAREIHDNVGHLLTRALYQAKMLETLSGQSAGNQDNAQVLVKLQNTVDEALVAVRNSVHDIYDENLELKKALQKIKDNYTFCEVFLSITEADIPIDVRDCFIKVVREALSNTAKHSDASRINIKVAEYQGFYQLMIADNGSKAAFFKLQTDSVQASHASANGLGLKSITDRVYALGGTLSISRHNGYKILVSIPKTTKESGCG